MPTEPRNASTVGTPEAEPQAGAAAPKAGTASRLTEAETRIRKLEDALDERYDAVRDDVRKLRDDKKSITLPRVLWYAVAVFFLVGVIYTFSCRKPATASAAVPDRAQAERNLQQAPPPPPLPAK